MRAKFGVAGAGEMQQFKRVVAEVKDTYTKGYGGNYIFTGDYHIHTTYSLFGMSTLNEYIAEAKMAGLQEIAITDACGSNQDADKHFEVFSTLPDTIHGIRVLKGIESYILPNGFLTTPLQLLHNLEWVMIVLSKQHGYRTDTDYARVIRSIVSDKRFNVKVLGHLHPWIGVLNVLEVVKACKAAGVLVEVISARLNSPFDEDHTRTLLNICKRVEAKIVISSGARHTCEIGDFSMLYPTLDELGFPRSLIYNIRS